MKVLLAIDCGTHEAQFEVVGKFTPGKPGRFGGPPENCYEATAAEFDVDSTWLLVPRGRVNLAWFPEGAISETWLDELHAKAYEQACEDYDAEEYDARCHEPEYDAQENRL